MLTGCGGADAGDGDSANESEAADGASPLSEYLGDGFQMESGGMMMVSSLDGGEVSEADKRDMRKVEEKIATCMDERGFEYVPHAPGSDEPSAFDDAFRLDPADFAEQYGYGISTLIFDDKNDDGAGDPNEKIREGLSEAARKEYDEALWGDVETLDDGGFAVAMPAEPDPEADPQEQGCQQQAADEVFGAPEDRGMTDMNEFQNLFNDIATLQERINNDPRVGAAEQAWAQCMAEAGHADVETVAQPQQSVNERMYELTRGPEGADPDAPSLTINPGAGADIDEADLEELQAFEIDIATADFDCQQEGYQEAFDEVSRELQEEFVRQHRDELERYRESMARDGGAEAGT